MPSIIPIPTPDAFHLEASVGWLLLENVREARAELEQIDPVHREHPDLIEAWWKVYSEEKNWSAALECGQKLSAAAPLRAMGWIAQAYALHEMQRTLDAFDVLHKVVERFHEHYVIPYNLACYQCRLGNKVAAMKWLHRAVTAANARTIREMALHDDDLAALRDEVQRLI